jgi:hypothetical protein
MTTQWINCVLHEEGWKTALAYLVLTVALIGLIAGLLRSLYRKPGSISLGMWEVSLRATEGMAVLVAAVALIALMFVTLSSFVVRYPASRTGFDSPSIPLSLETIRTKLLSETQSQIRIAPDAAQFKVAAGEYRARCVAALFDSICRGYPNELVCEMDRFNREISISKK